MKRFRNLVVFLSLSVIGLFLPGATSAASEETMGSPETIILISLDTTRADRMSCYGYEHETTPNIDALAKESLFFEHPFAPAPMTLPSHSSMFTGLIPPTHGVHENLMSNLPASALTLTEILKEQGFTTYGIVSTMVLKADRGLSQGFDHYDDAIDIGAPDSALPDFAVERNGKETTARALQWLSGNAEKKKFMFIHYYDAHSDYKPPAPFDTQFEDPYDGEIAFTDYCVGQILDRLKALGLYENALIALVGDHGEMLGEHGENLHSFFIYQNALRVPMMFKLPGAIQSRRIEEPVSLIDVAPTLLSMAGLAVPEAMQGVDLTSDLRPEFELPNRAIYSESMTPTIYNCSSLLGIVVGQWHYIQTKRPELYDRLKDPAEVNNLIAQYPAQASKMKDRLKRLLSEVGRTNVGTAAELDAAALEQLESLGYLDVDIELDYSFEEGEEDAKDMIGVRKRLTSASLMAHAGQRYQAIKSCTEIIEQFPRVAAAYGILVDIYIDLEEFDKAVDLMQRGRTVLPDNAETLAQLGNIYQRLNDAPNALTCFLDALALDPKSVSALVSTAATYFKMGDLRQALSYYEQALAQDANRADIHRMVARLKTTRGDPQLYDPPSALTHAERALQLCKDTAEGQCDDPTIFDTLSIVWAFNNNFDEAIATAARAMELYKLKGPPAQAERMKRLIGEFEKKRAIN